MTNLPVEMPETHQSTLVSDDEVGIPCFEHFKMQVTSKQVEVCFV